MNPENIYTNFRDEALAQIFSATSYSTFVAMPFRGRFSYNPKTILEEVIQKAVIKANEDVGEDLKKFKMPESIENAPSTATVITEDIVKGILYSTFFLADLTGGNSGVLIETGIAMSFKPNTQIILISQDPLEHLHFDIRNNRVILYNSVDHIDILKGAFLSAARSFETDRARYVTQVSKSLSTDAIRTLHCYASWYQNEDPAKGQPGLFYPDRMPEFFKKSYGDQAQNMFQLALLELLRKRMLWTDFKSWKEHDGNVIDKWATHATRLGWLLIKHMWPHYTDKFCERKD